MSAQSRGLGKGLGALIPTSSSSTEDDGEPGQAGLLSRARRRTLSRIPGNRARRWTRTRWRSWPPRSRSTACIQPLIVTRALPTARAPFQLIAGERRWRAAQLAGLEVVPVLLKEATPQQFLELALVENIQRADLNPLEEAEAYQALMSDFSLNQQHVAERVGKSRVAVANTLRLLRLPERVKTLLADGVLSEGHARALLGLPDDEAISARCRSCGEPRPDRAPDRGPRPPPGRGEGRGRTGRPLTTDDPDHTNTRQLEDAFRDALGTKVALTRGRKGGRLVISFYSNEELQTHLRANRRSRR